MARTANVGRLSVSLDANTILYINKIKKLADVNEKKLNQMERAFWFGHAEIQSTERISRSISQDI